MVSCVECKFFVHQYSLTMITKLFILYICSIELHFVDDTKGTRLVHALQFLFLRLMMKKNAQVVVFCSIVAIIYEMNIRCIDDVKTVKLFLFWWHIFVDLNELVKNVPFLACFMWGKEVCMNESSPFFHPPFFKENVWVWKRVRKQ